MSHLTISARILPILLAVACVTGASAEQAFAAPAWLTPTDLSTPAADVSRVRVASDAMGNTIAIWQVGPQNGVQTASRPAGGSWSAAQPLSTPGQFANEPSLAISEEGRAVAVWRSVVGGHWVVQVALRSPGSTSWSAPETISDPTIDIRQPTVAIGGGNRAPVAAAVWLTNAWPEKAQATAWTPQAGWSGAADLSAAGDEADGLALAVGADGEATAIWSGLSAGTTATVKAFTRLPGGIGWKGPVELASSTASVFVEPALAVDRSGQLTVVWSRHDSLESSVIQARTRPAGTGKWEPPFNLSVSDSVAQPRTPPIGIASEPRVQAGPPGEVTAVWGFVGLGPGFVFARTRAPGSSSWGQIVELSQLGPYESAGQPAIGGGANGKPVAVWTACGLITCSVKAAARTAFDTWEVPVMISPFRVWATSPDVAGDAAGNAVAAWPSAADEPEPALAQVAGYDAAGPQLRELEIPATGTVGAALTFSVAPVDVWSAVQPVEWEFGDGESGSGTTVSHTYRRPSTYAVQVTATDSLGNSTQETGHVRVHLPPLREAQKRPRP